MPVGARLTIDVGNAKIVDRSLSRFTGVVSDWTDAWPAVESIVLHETERQFASEGKYGSGGWKPLSDSYLTYKQNTDGLSTEIGTATGRLRKSLTIQDAHEGVRVQAPGEFLYGTTVPYFKHFNTERTAVQLPESARRSITRALQAHAMAVWS